MTEPSINAAALHPYSTYLIVEYTGSDVQRAIRTMADLLKQGLRPRGNRQSTLLASGFADTQSHLAVIGDDDIDGLDGFIFRDTTEPSWVSDSIYVDVEHHLVVIYARRRLLAVHAPRRLRTMVINRIRNGKNPVPFQLVRPSILRDAFLAGEAKGLWLHGVHPTSTTKADAKNLSGQRLQDALNTFEDSTFALRAGRAALAEDPSRVALRGTVGTTPGDAVVWNRPTDDFAGFVLTAREALDLIDATGQAGGAAGVLPQLARELDSLDGVHGAYEVVVSDPDFLPPGTSDEARDAAVVLQDALVDVRGDPNGPNLTLSVGPNGAEAGRLRCRVAIDESSRVSVDFGILGTPSHPEAVRPVLDALEHTEVFTVYYASGEVISGGTLTSRQTQHLPFHDWSIEDFLLRHHSRETGA